jgi:hypothetical protein
MVFIHSCLFLRRGSGSDASFSIKTCAVIDYGGIVDHGIVNIGIVYDGSVYIHNGGVVPESASLPDSPDKSHPGITSSIVNATIKSDVRAPVAGVPAIDSANITPVPWCPEQSDRRRGYPYARDPVITCFPIGPIAGSPHIPFHRAGGLNVYG